MNCIVNPFPSEISQDEFLLILNANKIYNNYKNLVDANEDLSTFFNQYKDTIDKGVKDIKQLRDFKAGKLTNLQNLDNNPIINYYINNNVDQNILNIFDQAFINRFYNLIKNSGKPISEFINLNEIFKSSTKDAFNNNNLLVTFFSDILTLKRRLEEELKTKKNKDGTPSTEYDLLFKERTIEYINSLNFSNNTNNPITSLTNFKENARLRQLINFIGRDGLFTLNDKLVENVNNEQDDLENNIQIYEKDPLTENPSNKISARLKLMLRGIPYYDRNGKEVVKNNLRTYWKPSDLLFKLLQSVTQNNINNFDADEILKRLTKISTDKENILSNPASIFLDRFNAVRNNNIENKSSNPDVLTDLFLYFQLMPVGIKVSKETQTSVDVSDENGNPTKAIKTNVILEDRTNYLSYNLKKVRYKIAEDLKNNTKLKPYLNNQDNLTITQDQVNDVASIIGKILKSSLLENEFLLIENLQKNLNSLLKSNKPITLISLLTNVVNANNILNSEEVNKVYNVNNDTLYPVIGPSELTEMLSLVNNSIELVKKNIPFEQTPFYIKFQNDIVGMSLWADYVKNQGNNLSVSIFTAFTNENETKEWSNFSDKDLIANLFNILKTNSFHTPILSDKSNIYLIDNYDYNPNFSGGFFDNIEENNINYFDYVMSFLKIDNTLNNLIESNVSIGKNINNAFKTQTLFLFNPELYQIKLNDELVTSDYMLSLYKTYSESKDTKEKNNAKNTLEIIIAQYYDILGNNLVDRFIENNLLTYHPKLNVLVLNKYDKLIDKTLYPQSIQGSKKLISDIKAAAVKSYIFNTHFSILVNGHPAFFKKNDEQKRTKAIVSDTKKPNVTASYKGKKVFNSTNVNGRRIILKDVEKTVINEIAEKFMLQDLINKNTSKENILNEMSNLFSNYVLLDGTNVYSLEKNKLDKIKEEYNSEVEKINTSELTEDEKNTKLEKLQNTYLTKEKEVKYKETKKSNTTDASSIASLDYSRRYHISLNMYSDDQEEFYNAEKSGKKLKKFTYNNNKIVKNAVYTKVKSKNSDILVEHMEKTSTDNFTAERIFIGETPNIYQAMIGKMFGYTFDEKNKSWSYNPNNALIDKVVYESAVKAEVLTLPNGDPAIFDLEQEILNKNITSLEDVNSWKPEPNFIENYIIEIPITEDRLQVETPEHLESEGDLGTQIESLINNSIELDTDYFINNKVFSGKELTQMLNSLRIAMVNQGETKLNNDLFNEDKIFDLISTLYTERDNLNLETLTPEKVPQLLKNPQFGFSFVPKIQSLIKKNVVKTKMNTAQFFNGVVGTDESLQILTEEVVDNNGNKINQIVFEVAVPAFSEDVFNTALDKEGNLDVNLLPKEIKDLIVYRIPTEAVYSMFVVRIKKLLHPSSGPIIYMPIGTTTIAGFDMDIDKLFAILKNYKLDENQKIKIINYSLDKDSDINFKEWFKENLSELDRLELNKLYLQKEVITEKNKENLTEEDNIILKETNSQINSINKKYKNSWLTLPLMNQLGSKQMQNLNFDILKGVISSQNNSKTYLQGNNFNRLNEINDEKELNTTDTKTLKDRRLNEKFAYKDKNIENALNTFRAIMSGANNIGPTAIYNQFIANLKFLNNFKPEENNYGFLIGGNVKFNSNNTEFESPFSAIQGIKNNQAKVANATLLAQAVDNIKKDLSVPLNLHKNLMGLRALLYIVGMDENIVDRLFTEIPEIDSVIKNAIKKGTLDKINSNIFFPSNLKQLNNDFIKLTFNNDGKIINYDFNLDYVLKPYIKNKNVEEILNLNPQDILIFLYAMQNVSNELNNLIQTVNSFYKGFGKNLPELIYSYKKTEQFFQDKTIEKNAMLNIDDSFIDYKLKVLSNVTDNIYKIFNVDLSDSMFNYYIDSNLNPVLSNLFFKPKYLGYLLRANISSNLYINLLAKFGSVEKLQQAYFKEISDLRFVFGKKLIVEKQGDSYIPAKTQNLDLDILQEIITFVPNEPSFAKNIQDLILQKDLYPFDLQFLGNTESINTIDSPKKVIDLMTENNQTLYAGGNTEEITDDNVFTSKQIAQKLFFVNMVQSALFSGKTNNGRSNVFELLFFDNIYLQNVLIDYINESSHDLFKNNYLSPELINDKIYNSLYNFLIINNPDLFEKQSIKVNNIKTNKTRQSLFNIFKVNLNNNNFLVRTDEVISPEGFTNDKIKFFQTKYVIVEIDGINYLFKSNRLEGQLFNYTNLGIINNFNSKFKPIAFNFLQETVNELGISLDNNIQVKQVSTDKFIRKSNNYREYGVEKPISFEKGTDVDQLLLQEATGIISEVNPNITDVVKNSIETFNKPVQYSRNSGTKENLKLRYKFNTGNNETILLNKTFLSRDTELTPETKKMVDGHIKLNNKFIFNNNLSNKLFLDYLISKNYTNFEIFGQIGKNKFSDKDVSLLVNTVKDNPIIIKNLNNKPEDSEENFDSAPDCI